MITIKVDYELGHQYTEQWEESEILCPFCCAREVWRHMDSFAEGGQPHICAHCWMSFEIDQIVEPGHNMQFLCRKKAIESARAKPVSPQAEGQTVIVLSDEQREGLRNDGTFYTREKLRVPTLQDLHEIFAEEEVKLEREAKKK